MPERLLVLAVDIDNDLYRKTRITGPVVGREDNLKAAAALVLADPQDTDGNTMFEAVKKYDELKKQGYKVNIVTITGAEKEGYVADAELSRQIDIVLDRFKSDACVLVTDGASDNRVLPLLKTRIKVNSVDILRMKQAEQFENTYFTILEKLKEPHYARIVFGIPAAILLLFAVSYYFHFGWQLPVGLIGLYLVIKGLGIEDSLVQSFKGLGFSIDRFSFIFYVGAILFFFIAIAVSYGSYASAVSAASGPLTTAAYTIEGFLIIFPISLLLYIVGRIMDLENKRMVYKAIKQGTYMGYGIIGIALLYIMSAWFIGQIYFWQLLVYSLVGILAGYGVSLFSSRLKSDAIRRARMKNKHVINDIGAYIGKVVKVQPAKSQIFVKTNYGTVISYDVDRIVSVADRVVIR